MNTTSATSLNSPAMPEWKVSHAAGAAAMTALVVWATSSLDHAAFQVLYMPEAARHWGVRGVKWMGTLTPWIVVALILLGVDGFRARLPAPERAVAPWRWQRGATLLASGVGGGALAEILKIVFRRERPVYHDGLQMLRSIGDRPFYSGGLDLPSSHVGVAFGMCCALSFMFPPARFPALLLASCVGVARMVEGSHSLSGVALGAAVGWSCARLFSVLFRSGAEMSR